MGRRTFTREFKLEAVKLVTERGISKSQAARDLGIHVNVLRNWIEDFKRDAKQAFPGRGKLRADDAEIARLKRELADAKAEPRHPKKSHSLLREGTAMRFAFIARHKAAWQIRQLCSALEVTRGGFYEWLKRPQSVRAVENDQLLAQIRTSFEQSDSTYGSPRVWRDVTGWGYQAGIHRIARLMRLAGLKARKARRRLPFDTGERPEHSIAPNHLAREFHADAPNKRWVADFTYIWTQEGWLYFAVVLDLFSRRVVGWSMRNDMTAALVTDALVMALWRRGRPKELLHHSDQGSQYTSEQCQKLLADSGVVCSMSRRGDVWDNPAMESFFASLKKERVYRRNYATRDQARADLFDYVERFYNQRRLHSTIGYMSPAAYEASVGLR